MKTLENIRKHKRGLSLVELMVVLAIMSILAAVAIPSYLKYQKNARDAVVESMLHIIDRTITFEIARDIPLSTLKTSSSFDEIWDEVRSGDRELFTKPGLNVGKGTAAGANQQWCILIEGKSGTDYEGYSGCVSNNTATPNKVLVVGEEEGNCTDFKTITVSTGATTGNARCPRGCQYAHGGYCVNSDSTTYKAKAECTSYDANCIVI